MRTTDSGTVETVDPVNMISLLADIPQLCEYASRVYRAFNPKDSAMVAWKAIVDSSAEAAVHAHGGDLSPGQQTAIFGRLHELLAANDERAWSVLGGPAAVAEADLRDFSLTVLGLVETFSRELTARLAAEASRPGSPLTNLSIVSSLSSIGGGVNRIETAVSHVSRRMEAVAESVLSVVSDRAADLSETPVPVQRALAAARQIDDDGARRLERIITSGQGPATALAQVLGPNPPGWWRSAGGVTVIAAGEYAAAYGQHAAASRLFESAADLENTSRARCLARAALESSDGDPSRAAALAERALQLDGDDLFVRAVPEVLARDFGAALDLLGSEPHADDPEMLILAGMQRLALANTERLSDAISVARQAIELRPDAAGMLLQLALLLRARAESTRASREADLAEAMDAALRARDLRRTWHGDSAEAVVIACEIAHQLEDRSTIRRLGLEPPDGDAIRTEAADDKVIAIVAVSAAIDGDDALAERLLPQVTSSFHRHMLLGMKSARRGESEVAARELREAVSEADDDSHLAWALRGLANLGEWPLPGLEEFAKRNPTEAEVIRGMSELNRDLIAEGIRRLSALRRTSSVVPVLLAEAHESAGRPDVAVEELRAAFENHGDPSFLAMACQVLMRADRSHEAEQIAAEAMSVVPASRPLRGELRQLLIELASRRGDHRRVEDLASAGIAEGDNDRSLRWHLVHVLHLRNAHEEAWDVVQREPPLKPTTEQQAELWLHAHARADPRRTTVTQMLHVVSHFPDSEEVQGTALVLFYTRRGEQRVEEDEGEAIKAMAETFVTRWPESEIMWSKTVDPENEERFAEQITEIAKSTAGRGESMLRLGEMYDAGQAPYGLVARLAGITLAEGLVGGLRRMVVAVPSDADERCAERDQAADGLDATVSIDLTAAYLADIYATGWTTISSNLRRIVVVDQVIADVESAMAALSLDRGGSVGWDDLTGRPVLTGPEPELDAQHREAVRRLTDRLKLVDNAPCAELGAFPKFDGRAASWLGPLQMAIDAGIPLYSDDLALRRLARGLSIPAFGTVAIVEALAVAGRISVVEQDEWLRVLHNAHVVDVYTDIGGATGEGRSALAAAGCLSRPWAWSTSGVAERLLSLVISSGSPEALALGGYCFGVGACRFLNIRHAIDRCARLIETLISDIRTVSAAAGMIGRLRRSCMERGIEDPLPQAVRNMQSDLRPRVSRDEAARLTLSLFSCLGADEQQIVLRTLSFA